MAISLSPPLGQAPTGFFKKKIVTGQRLAKSSVGYPSWVRARDAVRWMRGEIVVEPTAKLAGVVFGVSYFRMRQAQAALDGHAKRHTNGDVTIAPVMSDAVVERFVTEVGIERVWSALDRLTQPQLPLRAAE